MVFDGEEIKLANQVGYAYFHFLMMNHPKEFSDQELEQAVRGNAHIANTRQSILDKPAIQKILKRAEYLKERIV
jgi:hypothetical protein